MTPPRKLFISFSSQDNALIRRLYHALRHPALDVWDYSSPLEALPPGHDLAESLRSRLAQTDDVLVVVSEASLHPANGTWVRFEIEVAIASGLRQRGRIVPIVVDRVHVRPWPAPLDALQGLTFVEVSPAEPQSFDHAVSRLYLWLGVERAPAIQADGRLPVADRLREELEGFRGTLEVYVYNEVMRLAERFEEAYERADYDAALKRIEALRYRLDDELPASRWYYPDVVKGVCELHLGRVFDAERTFQTLCSHPAADESAWGGLGLTLIERRRYADAVAAFEKALEQSPGDARTRYNLVLARCLAGVPRPTQGVDIDSMALQADERVELFCLLADVHRREGRPDQAERLISALRPEEVHEVAAMQLAQALAEQGRVGEAVARLEARARARPEFSAWHLLARLHLQQGTLRRALEIYEGRLAAPPLVSRQTIVERARVLTALGRRSEASWVCRDMLERSPFGLPATAEEFYWDGLANHLLGRRDRADYDWSRSRGFGPPYQALLEMAR